MTDVNQLAVPAVRELQAYPPGKPVEMLERELGVSNAVKLASNENPCGPSPKVVELLKSHMPDLARYPDGGGYYLRHALAEKHSLEASQVTLGNGSNDVLEMVARAFANHNHNIIFSEHAFAVYPIVTQAVGAQAKIVAAKNWGNDLEAIQAAIDDATRVIFIANPNNPTGTWLTDVELKTFLDGVPDHVIVVLDEAYFEYAVDSRFGVENYPDGSHWVNAYANLIVTRTFSKAYGLAGLRIGYGLSSAAIANILDRVRQPFNVNTLALMAAETALQDDKHLQYACDINISGMQQVTEKLKAMSLSYIPSIGNFLTINFDRPAAGLYEKLLHEGIIVRPVANYAMPNHLRVTIGLPEENNRFLVALEKVLA